MLPPHRFQWLISISLPLYSPIRLIITKSSDEVTQQRVCHKAPDISPLLYCKYTLNQTVQPFRAREPLHVWRSEGKHTPPMAGLCWVLDKACVPMCSRHGQTQGWGGGGVNIYRSTHTHGLAVAMEAIPSIPQTNKLHRCRIVAHRLSGPKHSEELCMPIWWRKRQD